MTLDKPVRPKPVSALVMLILLVVAVVLLCTHDAVVFGIIFAVFTPFLVLNVFFGGGFNDSPLDLAERLQRFRSDGFDH